MMINCPFLSVPIEHNALFKDKFDGRGSRLVCVCVLYAGGGEIDLSRSVRFDVAVAVGDEFSCGNLIMSYRECYGYLVAGY